MVNHKRDRQKRKQSVNSPLSPNTVSEIQPVKKVKNARENIDQNMNMNPTVTQGVPLDQSQQTHYGIHGSPTFQTLTAPVFQSPGATPLQAPASAYYNHQHNPQQSVQYSAPQQPNDQQGMLNVLLQKN